MKTIVVLIMALFLLGFLVSGGPGYLFGQKASVQIENGVTVVRNPENPVARDGRPVAIRLVEDLVLGSGAFSPETSFSAATFVLVDDEDHFIVFDNKDVSIRIFDKSGRFLRKFGKRGQGPDEIQAAMGMMLSGGKDIVIVDAGNNRLAFYSQDGTCLKRTPLIKANPNFPVMDSRGNFYGAAFEFAEKVSLNLFKFGPDGKPLSTLGSIPMPRENELPPFELMERFVFQIRPDDALVWAGNFRYELNVAAPDGKILRRITRNALPEKVTRRILDKEFKRRFPDRTLPESMPIPSHYPKYFPYLDSILCDEEGRLFVSTLEGYGSGSKKYDVFDLDGFYIARFALPESETMTAVKRGKAYVVIREDKGGNPLVKRYRLEEK